MIAVADAIPSTWTSRLTREPLGLGLDLATTEKQTSNPSSLSVNQRAAGRVIYRLIVSWKTRDPDVTRAVLRLVLDQIAAAAVARPRRLCIDASNEVFFATDLKKAFGARLPIELIKGGENIEFRNEKLNAKTLLGNLYASLLEDGLCLLPADDWIALDHRLVKREAGGFVTDTGKDGQHGDTFDSCKLAYWSLTGSGGNVTAEPLQVGTYGSQGGERPGLKNPWRKHHRGPGGGICA